MRVAGKGEDADLSRLAAISQAPKSFDSWPEWEVSEGRTTPILHFRAPLRIDGLLGPVIVHLTTPQAAWEDEMIGQVEVRRPTGRSSWGLDTIEWNPRNPHSNPPGAPAELRFLTLTDRMHPFALNRRLGLDAIEQKVKRIGVEFPRAITTFTEYCDLCAEVWHCPDMRDVPPPTWFKKLF